MMSMVQGEASEGSRTKERVTCSELHIQRINLVFLFRIRRNAVRV